MVDDNHNLTFYNFSAIFWKLLWDRFNVNDQMIATKFTQEEAENLQTLLNGWEGKLFVSFSNPNWWWFIWKKYNLICVLHFCHLFYYWLIFFSRCGQNSNTLTAGWTKVSLNAVRKINRCFGKNILWIIIMSWNPSYAHIDCQLLSRWTPFVELTRFWRRKARSRERGKERWDVMW